MKKTYMVVQDKEYYLVKDNNGNIAHNGAFSTRQRAIDAMRNIYRGNMIIEPDINILERKTI